MKKRHFWEIAILVLVIIFISFSAQAYAITTNDGDTLNSNATFLLTEESQNFALCETGIHGHVINRQSDPIQGVEVTAVFYEIEYRDYTDPNGYYIIILPDMSGLADMKFEKIGYWTHTVKDVGILKYQLTQLDVTLEYCPVQLTGIIVYVNDAFSGAPIEEADVYAYFDANIYMGETGWNGCCEIELPTLDYQRPAYVEVNKRGYSLAYRVVNIDPGGWITLHFGLYPYPQQDPQL